MSINVEMIGSTLMIQHYVAEVATGTLCRMVSISDAFTPNPRAGHLDSKCEASRRALLRIYK
jgi:hypothetical protein